MHVIVATMNEKDRMKKSREKVATSIFRCSRAGNSVVRGQIWPNFELIQALIYVSVTCRMSSKRAEFRTPPSSYACYCYLQEKKGSDQKQQRESGYTVFPIITLQKISVAMETRVMIRSDPKPYAAFTHSNDASDKI